MKGFALVLLVALLKFSALAADPEPYLKSAPLPFYPHLARQARIEGKVDLRFVVNEQGDTSEVEALNGHKLLQGSAIHDIQDWKFGWAHPCACRVKKEVVFIYSISRDWADDNGPDSIVKWYGNSPVVRVEIQAGGMTFQP